MPEKGMVSLVFATLFTFYFILLCLRKFKKKLATI